jgi:hypothetical protein
MENTGVMAKTLMKNVTSHVYYPLEKLYRNLDLNSRL